MRAFSPLTCSGVAAATSFAFMLAGCAPVSSISEDEFVRELSIRPSLTQGDAPEVTITVNSGVSDPDLREQFRTTLISADSEQFLGEQTSILGATEHVVQVPADSVPDMDLTAVTIQVEYAVYRGDPPEGELLFSGTVGIEDWEHSDTPGTPESSE